MNIEPLSERLKRARKAKGFTLEELQKKTKVHINILKAIEGESLTNLSPVYLKGFIKIYCNALEVDYKDYIPDSKEAILPKDGKKQDKEAGSFLKSVEVKLNTLKPNNRFKKIIVILILLFLLVLFLFRIGGCISLKRRQMKDLSARQQVSTSTPSQPQSLAIPKEAMEGIRLVVSAKERCLVFVKVDGKVVFHRLLEKGRSNTWRAKERIDLSLGNASAVELIVNGERFTNLGGKRGQPLNNIVITVKEGLKIPR
ncbi:MAG: helix-turn-helix domain-containing protein [Candidatus Omnitrophota bacterium]